MLVFLFLKEATLHYSQNALILTPFLKGFQNSFAARSDPRKAQDRDPKQQIKKIKKQIIIETHPQPGPAQRVRLEGVKPLKLTTFPALSAAFLKRPRALKVKPKKEWI